MKHFLITFVADGEHYEMTWNEYSITEAIQAFFDPQYINAEDIQDFNIKEIH